MLPTYLAHACLVSHEAHGCGPQLAALTRAVENLAAELAGSRREVDRGLADLERASRAMSEIATRVGHDLRTPLTAILGFSELMSRGRLTNEAMREYAEDINRDARRLSELISSVFDADSPDTRSIAMHRARLGGADLPPGLQLPSVPERPPLS